MAQYLAFKAVENLISKDNKEATFKSFDKIENSEIDLIRAFYTIYAFKFYAAKTANQNNDFYLFKAKCPFKIRPSCIEIAYQ